MKTIITSLFGLHLLLFACSPSNSDSRSTPESQVRTVSSPSSTELAGSDTATFAGGCFWCTEAIFERTAGVVDVVSGYAGGTKPNPTYKEVSYGKTKYAEAVQVYFNPDIITYNELLEIFYATHDPTQLNRQGPDVGEQYRSEVFYHDAGQEKAVRDYQARLASSDKYDDPVVTKISPYTTFYKAEDYHQDYYENNPNQPYIVSVSRPKVEKFIKQFPDKLKAAYR